MTFQAPAPPIAAWSRPALLAAGSFAGAAACGVEAVRTHLWIASLGPICGLDRPWTFLTACPACPAALALTGLGAFFAAIALRRREALASRRA